MHPFGRLDPYESGPSSIPASSSRALLPAPVAAHIPSPNTSFLDLKELQPHEMDRLCQLFRNSQVEHSVCIAQVIYNFITEIKSLSNKYTLLELELKGGAVNYIKLGDPYFYSDVDFTLIIAPCDLIALKFDLDNWLYSRVASSNKCALITTDKLQFILLTIPGKSTPIDIQIICAPDISLMRSCTHSYNALRCRVLPFVTAIALNRELPSVHFHAVDGFTIEECEADIIAGRSRVKDMSTVHEGLRAHCALITKGIIPHSLAHENEMCETMRKQYQAHPDGFLRLEKNLINYLSRHYQRDQKSAPVFLLNFEDIIRRSSLQEKPAIQYDLASLCLRQLGFSTRHLGHNERIALMCYCRSYLFEAFSDRKQTYQLEGTLLHTLAIDPQYQLTVAAPEIAQTECILAEDIVISLHKRLKAVFSPPEKVFIPQPEPEPQVVLQDMAPIFNNLNQEIDQYIEEFDEKEFDLLQDIEKLLQLFSKIKHLKAHRRKGLGEASRILIAELINQNEHVMAASIYLQAIKIVTQEHLEDPLSQKLILEPLLSGLMTITDRPLVSSKLILDLYNLVLTSSNQVNPLLITPRHKRLLPLLPKWMSTYFTGLENVEYVIDVKKIIHLLLISYKRVDHSTQSGLRKSCLALLAKMERFPFLLEVLSSMCMEIKSKKTTNGMNEMIRVIEDFMEQVLTYSKEQSLACSLELFNSFSIVNDEERPAFDPGFKMLIKRQGSPFYMSIHDEILKFPFARFLSYFREFTELDDIIPNQVQIEKALQQGLIRIIEEVSSEKEMRFLIEEIFKQTLLDKYPVIQVAVAKALRKPDLSDFLHQVNDVLAEFTHNLSNLPLNESSYETLLNLLDEEAQEKSFTINQVRQLDAIIKSEKKRLQAINSKGANKQALSALHILHIFILTSSPNADKIMDPEYSTALHLFRQAVQSNSLLIQHFKGAVSALYFCKILSPSQRQFLKTVIDSTQLTKTHLFYHGFVSAVSYFKLFLSTHQSECLELGCIELKELNKHLPSEVKVMHEAYDLLDIIITALFQHFSQDNNRTSSDIKFLIHIIEWMLYDKKSRYLSWLNQTQNLTTHTSLVLKVLELLNDLVDEENEKVKVLGVAIIQLFQDKPSSSIQVKPTTAPTNHGRILKQVEEEHNSVMKIQEYLIQARDSRDLSDSVTILFEGFQHYPTDPIIIETLINVITVLINSIVDTMPFAENFYSNLSSHTFELETILASLKKNKSRIPQKSYEDFFHRTQILLKRVYVKLGINAHHINNVSHFTEIIEFIKQLMINFPESQALKELLCPFIFIRGNPDSRLLNEEALNTPNLHLHLIRAHQKYDNHLEALSILESIYRPNPEDILTHHQILQLLQETTIQLKMWEKALHYSTQLQEFILKHLSQNTIEQFPQLHNNRIRLQYKNAHFYPDSIEKSKKVSSQASPGASSKSIVKQPLFSTIPDLLKEFKTTELVNAHLYAKAIISFIDKDPKLILEQTTQIQLGVILGPIILSLLENNECLLAADLFLKISKNHSYKLLNDATSSDPQCYIETLIHLLFKNYPQNPAYLKKVYQVHTRLAWISFSKHISCNQLITLIDNDPHNAFSAHIYEKYQVIKEEYEDLKPSAFANPENWAPSFLFIHQLRLMSALQILYTNQNNQQKREMLDEANFLLTDLKTLNIPIEIHGVVVQATPSLLKTPVQLLNIELALEQDLTVENVLNLQGLLQELHQNFPLNTLIPANIFQASIVGDLRDGFYTQMCHIVSSLITLLKKSPIANLSILKEYPLLLLGDLAEKKTEIEYWLKLKEERILSLKKIYGDALGVYPKAATIAIPETKKLGLTALLKFKFQPFILKTMTVKKEKYELETYQMQLRDQVFETISHAQSLYKEAKDFFQKNDFKKAIPSFQKCASQLEDIYEGINGTIDMNKDELFTSFLLLNLKKIKIELMETYSYLEAVYIQKAYSEKQLPIKHYHEGISFLKDLQKQYPESNDLILLLAKCLAIEPSTAEEALLFLNLGNQNDPRILNAYVGIFYCTEKWALAISYFDKVDALFKTTNSTSLSKMGLAAHLSRQPEKSLHYYTRALESSKDPEERARIAESMHAIHPNRKTS